MINMISLVVFLGNPGKEYGQTRHNAGWMVTSQLKDAGDPIFWSKKFHGRWTTLHLSGRPVRLLQPLTYMNESGRSVVEAVTFFSLTPQEVLIVHDDLELPFGTVCLQTGGGLQGHNGLKSIAQSLSSPDFGRLRIGIGRPPHGTVSSFVTSRFSREEEIALTLILSHAGSYILQACTTGMPARGERVELS